MENKIVKIKAKKQRNNVLSLRLNEETAHALKSGLDKTGLTRTAYVRIAIIEKNKADSMK